MKKQPSKQSLRAARAAAVGNARPIPSTLDQVTRDRIASVVAGFAATFRVIAERTAQGPLTPEERNDLELLAKGCDELVEELDAESDRREFGSPETRQ
jgi:hypothetical protein